MVGVIVVIGGILYFMVMGTGVSTPTDQTSSTDIPDEVAESTIADDTKNWKTAPGDGLSFLYPAQFGTPFIAALTWPPLGLILNATGPLPCTEGTAAAGQMVKKVINNHTYCVAQVSEGTAGTVYTKYVYAFERDTQIVALVLNLRFMQCANFTGEKKTRCDAERQSFNVDTMADRIAQTFKLSKIEAVPDTSVVPAGS